MSTERWDDTQEKDNNLGNPIIISQVNLKEKKKKKNSNYQFLSKNKLALTSILKNYKL